jgi:hypothetical protein
MHWHLLQTGRYISDNGSAVPAMLYAGRGRLQHQNRRLLADDLKTLLTVPGNPAL